VIIDVSNSCQRIITQDQPGPQDCHGCPYKTFSTDNLQAALLAAYGPQGLTMNDLPEVLNSAKAGHYQIACTRVFEITHKLKKGEGVGDGESVDHPNR
jgi:DNA primase large subunit